VLLWEQIHQTVTSGGKVLVPVFAVGRAQELLMLLDEHWQRTELQVMPSTALPDFVMAAVDSFGSRTAGG
jgi:Cft2 family RNA processing exonuclease